MVNAIQTGAEWHPRFAPHGLKQQPHSEAFNVSPDGPSEEDEGFAAFGKDGFTLLDAVDIVNPLQHLPLIGTLYREITGDTLDPFSRVAGSTLFFGPLGTAVSGVNVAMEEFTGKDMGGHMMALFKDAEAPAPEIDIALGSADQNTSPEEAKPAAAGTNGLDPVTAWAMAELNFRNAEAEKLGIAVPERSYASLVASAAPASVSADEVAKITPPPQWSRPIEGEARVLPEEAKPDASVKPTQTPAEATALPLNEFHAVHRAAPETLLRLKQTTAAYQIMEFPTAKASDKKEEHVSFSQTPPKDPDVDKPVALLSERTPTSRPVAENGTWFSASMFEALGKYKQAETTDKSQLDQLTSKSSLH